LAYDPFSGGRADRPRVHSPRPRAGCLVCPLVEASSSSSSPGLTWPRQPAFASEHAGSVSGRLSTTISRRALISLSWFPAALLVRAPRVKQPFLVTRQGLPGWRCVCALDRADRVRAGARPYFGPRPSGWLRGRRQDV
jgi:hypothetical protein